MTDDEIIDSLEVIYQMHEFGEVDVDKLSWRLQEIFEYFLDLKVRLGYYEE